jgi:hypothetical protein
MAKKSNPDEKKSNTKNSEDATSKLAAHKIQDELNPHHQNARPKGKK